jgi:hypothetical protein
MGDGAPGGEPLWIVPEDLEIFFPARGRPNRVLNRRLPRITASDVFCPRFRSEIIDPLNLPTDPTRVETFPGAACLTPYSAFLVLEGISPRLSAHSKAAPLQGRASHLLRPFAVSPNYPDRRFSASDMARSINNVARYCVPWSNAAFADFRR